MKCIPSNHQTLKCNVGFQQTALPMLGDYPVALLAHFYFHIMSTTTVAGHFLKTNEEASKVGKYVPSRLEI